MQSGDYRLIVDGEPGDKAAQAFERMTLSRTDGTTVLVGPIRDQAELHGLFRTMSDLGLTLLHVEATDQPPVLRSEGRARDSHPAGVRPRSDRS